MRTFARSKLSRCQTGCAAPEVAALCRQSRGRAGEELRTALVLCCSLPVPSLAPLCAPAICRGLTRSLSSACMRVVRWTSLKETFIENVSDLPPILKRARFLQERLRYPPPSPPSQLPARCVAELSVSVAVS
jgi:hypothetical protein